MQRRGMSLVEIMVVVAVVGALAAGAMASMSAIATRQRATRAMDKVLDDIQQQRIAHVASGREELLTFCVDCIDDTGAPHTPTDPHRLNIYLMDDPLTPDRGRPVLLTEYEELELSIPTAPHVAMDALGRSVTCDTRAPKDVKLKIVVERKNEDILFGGDGKLDPSFAAPLPQLAPHAQNISARTTPVPMPRGSFTGDATRATGLTLH